MAYQIRTEISLLEMPHFDWYKKQLENQLEFEPIFKPFFISIELGPRSMNVEIITLCWQGLLPNADLIKFSRGRLTAFVLHVFSVGRSFIAGTWQLVDGRHEGRGGPRLRLYYFTPILQSIY